MAKEKNAVSRKEENQELLEYFQAECEKLPENIQNLRTIYGESQTTLANLLHVTKSTISNYESGLRTPSIFILLAIAHHYGLTVERLIYGDFRVKILSDKVPLNEKDSNKIIWETILEIISTDQAMENKHFQEAYQYHCKIFDQLIEGKGYWDYYTINKYQKLYRLAAEEGVREAIVNLLWYPMCKFISTSMLTYLGIEESSKYDNDSPAITMYKDTMMPSPENPENPELEEKKSNVLDAYRLEIYTLLRILKQSNVAEYRDLADYYTALMYRFNFRTDALSPEESYVIGTELLAMGRIMGNPYANRYLKMFDLFRYEDEDDDTEDEDDSGDKKS